MAQDLVYVFILVGSVAIAPLLRCIPTAARASASAAIGAAAICGACQLDAHHFATALLLAIAVQKCTPPRRRGLVMMALVFAHLGIVRLLPTSPNGPANAAQLILTLRLAACGFHAPESTFDLVCYACCYHGIFTGPFYSHAAWKSAMSSPSPWPTPRALGAAVLRALTALGVWLVTKDVFPFQWARDASNPTCPTITQSPSHHPSPSSSY